MPLKPRATFIDHQLQLEKEGIAPFLARLYASRGVKTKKSLEYDLKNLLPPAALTNAETAAILLADALEASARIVIIGDYDCDGATATALAVRALRLLSSAEGAQNIRYLVPDRFIYGYGLTPAIVELAAQESPDLLITVDNGIASIEGILCAQELGIATLITDHHLAGEALPEADCIVNPNQANCDFPSKNLAGVGVIFYVMLALRAELRTRGFFSENNIKEPNFAHLLDLVALGTVADVVKLDDNNRILVHQGLERMKSGKLNAGIAALFRLAGRDFGTATTQDLGFIIAPRLNAAGRLADMSIGIECLLCDDYDKALAIAQQLDELNRERKEIEAGMQEEALRLLASVEINDAPALILFNDAWHQGVIGILAARLKDKFHRPTFIFAAGENGELKGSGRSIAGFHLRDALDLISKKAPDLLQRFGGHAMAAGATIAPNDFETFKTHFSEIAQSLLNTTDLEKNIETDGALQNGDISLLNARLIEQQIWGQGFVAPIFEGEFKVIQQRILKDKHLKMRLENQGAHFEAIWFNFVALPTDKIRAAYRLNINQLNGVQSIQLMIEAIENL